MAAAAATARAAATAALVAGAAPPAAYQPPGAFACTSAAGKPLSAGEGAAAVAASAAAAAAVTLALGVGAGGHFTESRADIGCRGTLYPPPLLSGRPPAAPLATTSEAKAATDILLQRREAENHRTSLRGVGELGSDAFVIWDARSRLSEVLRTQTDTQQQGAEAETAAWRRFKEQGGCASGVGAKSSERAKPRLAAFMS